MDQTTRSRRPSKGEVAFRFIASAGIALALYGAPELKGTSDASNSPTLQADTLLRPDTRSSSDACAARGERQPMVSAALVRD